MVKVDHPYIALSNVVRITAFSLLTPDMGILLGGPKCEVPLYNFTVIVLVNIMVFFSSDILHIFILHVHTCLHSKLMPSVSKRKLVVTGYIISIKNIHNFLYTLLYYSTKQ